VHRAETAAYRAARIADGLPAGDGPTTRNAAAPVPISDRPRHRQPARAGHEPGRGSRRSALPVAASRPCLCTGSLSRGHHRPPRGQPSCYCGTRRRPVSRPPSRDRDAERSAVRAADRLLVGTPLRSATGKLTGTELTVESGLRRDVVYGDHKDLVEEFQASQGSAVHSAGGPGCCCRARCTVSGTRRGPAGTGPGTIRHRSSAENRRRTGT
jgi:hypothetical protein